MYLLTIGAGAAHRLGMSTDVATTVGYALLVPYLVVALKRVYPESLAFILLKAGSLTLLMTAFNGLANSTAIRLTLALA
jgi:hypothetical protein